MPRSTHSGTPFLVLRADSRRYIYWRNLRPDLALFVTGAINLSWSVRPFELSGKTVVKISLKTGDMALARLRWGEVHHQIERLIERGVALAKSEAIVTPALASDVRAAIAAQARHDVMADHDNDFADPESMSPLARGLARALEQRDAGRLRVDGASDAFHDGFLEFLSAFPANMTIAEIRDAARTIEAASVNEMLATNDIWPLDGPAGVIEEIVVDPKSPGGIRVFSTKSLPSELTNRLAENGLNLREEKERRKAGHAVLMAKKAGFQDIDARRTGKAIETPVRPASIDDAPDEVLPTVRELHDKWVARVRPDRKTREDNLLYVERFISLHGNLRIDQVKRKQVVSPEMV